MSIINEKLFDSCIDIVGNFGRPVIIFHFFKMCWQFLTITTLGFREDSDGAYLVYDNFLFLNLVLTLHLIFQKLYVIVLIILKQNKL